MVRNLEVIGEPANRLPGDFKKEHSDIEWAKIVGLRHRIVHEYFGVDLDIIWQIIRSDLPVFEKAFDVFTRRCKGVKSSFLAQTAAFL